MALKNLLSEKRLKPVDISTATPADFDANGMVVGADGRISFANGLGFSVKNHPDLFKPLTGVQAGDIPKGYAYIDSATGKVMESDAVSGIIQEHNALWGSLPTIKTNETAIGNNASAISTNTSNISTNASDISTNTGNISTNTSDISTNAGEISSNKTDITANASAISTNTGNISTNTANIATNTGNISTNTANISTNTSDISTNTGDIATNTSGISSLSTKVSNGFTASGLAADGTFVSFTATNYLNASTSLTSALDSLDINLFSTAGGLQTLTGRVGDVEATASNLLSSGGAIYNANGSWSGFTGTNYINAASNIGDAIDLLDKEIANIDKSEFHAVVSGSYSTSGLGVFEASADIKNGSGSPTTNTVSYDEVLVIVDDCEIDTAAVENGLANAIHSTAVIYNYSTTDYDITYKTSQSKRFLDTAAWIDGANAGTTSAGASDLPDAITVGAGQKVRIYIEKDPYGITTSTCVGYFLVESI